MIVFFFLKILVLVILAILIRGVLPRYRVDQIIYKNWKIVFFLVLAFIFLFLFNFFLYHF